MQERRSHHEDEQPAWRLHHRTGWREHELFVPVDADAPHGQLTEVRTNLRALEREPFLFREIVIRIAPNLMGTARVSGTVCVIGTAASLIRVATARVNASRINWDRCKV